MKQKQRMHTDSDTIVNALSVSPNEDDHRSPAGRLRGFEVGALPSKLPRRCAGALVSA